MFKRYLAFILLTVLVLTSFVIPTYADSAIGEIGTEEMGPIENDRVPLKDSYTEDEIKSILAGDHNFDIPEEGIKFSAENFPLEVDENVVSPNAMYIEEDDYYITVLSSGEILRSPNSSYVTTISYYETAAYMWVFEEVDMFTYAIRNKADPDRCLAVSQLSSGVYSVITKIYSATDTTCHWSMTMTSDGNYIQSEAVGTDADGQYLYLSGKRFLLNSSKCTYIGLVDVDWFVPCTSIYMGEYISVPYGSTATFSILETTPSNANVLGDNYMTYTVADSSVCSLNVRNKTLAGLSIGSTTLTATHKMTGATGTVKVHVGYPTKIKAYYDNAFETLCEEYDEYNDYPRVQVEEWFEKVKKKYAEDLDIHLILMSVEKTASYPEISCPNGDDPNKPCGCTSQNNCQNGSALHHKNIYNILAEEPMPDTDKNLNVFFTGHNICYPSSQGHDSGNMYGLCFYEEGSCIIATNRKDYEYLTFYDNNIQREKYLISIIAHEIGHFFQNERTNLLFPFYGLDHYGYGDGNNGMMPGPTGTQTNNCIWGSGAENHNIYENLVTCPGCTSEIKSNAGRYNHQ